MPGYMNVPAAIETAQALLKRKAELMAQIDTVRSDLRNAVVRGEGTADEQKWIGENFPVRERKTKTKK